MNIQRRRTLNSLISHNRHSTTSYSVHFRDSWWSQSQNYILRGICRISMMWWIYVEFQGFIHVIAVIYSSKTHCIQSKWISVTHFSNLQDRFIQEENNHSTCFNIFLSLPRQSSSNLIQTIAHSIYRFILFSQVRIIYTRLCRRVNQRTLLSRRLQRDSLFRAFN